jgi:hypothetical protein
MNGNKADDCIQFSLPGGNLEVIHINAHNVGSRSLS